MARKYEFKPDSENKNLLQRLQLTRQQRRGLLKWLLYTLLLIFISVVQDVFLSQLRNGLGATTDLVPCLIILICVIEGTQTGSVFALCASLFYLFSVSNLGPYVVFIITFLAVFVTSFRQGYLRRGFPAALLCVSTAMLVYEMLMFGINLFLKYTIASRVVGFLITAGLSIVAIPLLYFPVKAINGIGDDAWKE